MPDTERKVLAKYRMERAQKCLNSADNLLSMEDYLAVLNRSYYAIFHAVRSILALDGIDRKKHSGVISYFQQNYVKTEIFNKEFSRIVQEAFEVRQEADYEDFYVISKEEVEIQMSNAKKFVDAVEEYLKNIIC